MNKKLLLMSCLCFELSAGTERVNATQDALTFFILSKQKPNLANIQSTTRTMQNEKSLASSPSSVFFIDDFLQASSEQKQSDVDVKCNRLVNQDNQNEAPRFSGLKIRRPVSLDHQASLYRQSSDVELSGLIPVRNSYDKLFRVHSSQLNFNNFGMQSQGDDCPVPTPSNDCVIGSPSPVPTPTKDCVIGSPSPVSPSKDCPVRTPSTVTDSPVKHRSYSNASDDFFLASVSMDSPRKNSSRSLSGSQSYVKLYLDNYSPKK
jgi:hypothetical protein